MEYEVVTMNDANELVTKTPWHLWLVGLLAILWYLNGLYDFASTITGQVDYTAKFTETMRDFYGAMPVWAITAWGLAELFGITGGVLLLFKSQFALHAFTCAIVAICVNLIYNFVLADASKAIGSSAVYFEIIVVVSTLLCIAYSYWMKGAGIIR
jgi:hypothetical protein